MIDGVDYGPLEGLVGVWEGAGGVDVAPEPDGQEETPYFETITFEVVGDVTNAEQQTLAVIGYHQVVSKKENDEVFHDQRGYWTWDPATDVITESVNIPRVVAVLASGQYAPSNGEVTLSVAAAEGDADWGIIQSPFMRDNARTTAFEHSIKLSANTLEYSETTSLEIYGRSFAHTDGNTLARKG